MDVRAALNHLKEVTKAETDAELADRLGVPYFTLNNWKKRNSIPLPELEEIASRFSVSLDKLVFGHFAFETTSSDFERRTALLAVRMAISATEVDKDVKRVLLRTTEYFARWARLMAIQFMEGHGLTEGAALEKLEELALRLEREGGGLAFGEPIAIDQNVVKTG